MPSYPDIMITLASLSAFILGFCHVVDPEFAWSLHEMDARVFYGKTLSKARNWQERLSIWGAALILVGGIGVLVGMGLI